MPKSIKEKRIMLFETKLHIYINVYLKLLIILKVEALTYKQKEEEDIF